MATESEHVACANRTQQMIRHLLSDAGVHSPWIATTAFYKALHLVEAAFANDSSIGHAANHAERELFLKRTRRYQKIYGHYASLERAATNARYLGGFATFDDYMSAEDVIEQLLKHHLKQLENSVRKFLTAPEALAGVESGFLPASRP